MSSDIRSTADLYAWALDRFFAMPYQWGGDGVTGYGIDCSGLVQLILSRVGLDPKGDQGAAALYEHAVKSWVPDVRAQGAVAFFGTNGRVTHTGWMIDRHCMLNASGGGAHIKTLQQAANAKAGVKIQPIAWYKTPALMRVFMPDYGKAGLV
jgi:cell wall-associated NlpC family hydrolase